MTDSLLGTGETHRGTGYHPSGDRINPDFLSLLAFAPRLEKSSVTLAGLGELEKASKDRANTRQTWKGLAVTIEVPKGDTRSGVSKDGKEWSAVMREAAYGYFSTAGKDGEGVDVFLAEDDPESEIVFVINQVKKDGRLDEHKVVCCVSNEARAREVYLAAYEDGWQGLGSVKAMTLPDFKSWLKRGDMQKRARESNLPAIEALVAATPADDLVGTDVYVHDDPFLTLVVIDVADWGVEKPMRALGERISKVIGSEHVIYHNEQPKPRGGAWVHLETPAATKSGIEEKHPFTITVDLDGTLAEIQEPFDPDTIGEPRDGAKELLEAFRDAGARVVIFTVRGDRVQVRNWLEDNDLPFSHINENPDQPENTSGKVIADLYVDDRAIDARDLGEAKDEVLARMQTKEARCDYGGVLAYGRVKSFR